MDLHERLKSRLAELGSLAVAFSGGVDSTLLVKVAHEVLGDAAVAVTMESVFVPRSELDEARAFCEREGIRHVLLSSELLSVPEVADNPPDRCYHCKRAVFEAIGAYAATQGIAYVADGSNLDDGKDYRPGMRAIAELGVVSPLFEAGFTKAEVRALSQKLGLPTWSKPSAACLASRIPYGDAITPAALARIDAAEEALRRLGFDDLRVRAHGDLARLELPPARIAEAAEGPARGRIVSALQGAGFRYLSLDLQGYRMGSLNEALPSEGGGA